MGLFVYSFILSVIDSLNKYSSDYHVLGSDEGTEEHESLQPGAKGPPKIRIANIR